MNMPGMVRLTVVAVLLPLQLSAQADLPERSVRWQPAVYAGVWGVGSASSQPGEPGLGPMAALELRRIDSRRRISLVTSLSGYTKGRGLETVSLPAPGRQYQLREDLLVLSVGADVALLRGPTDWTVGLSLGAGTSRIATREVSQTGLPFSQGGDDSGWNAVTGVLSARSGVTVPLSSRWGLRLGAEVMQGVTRLGDGSPILGAHVGVVMRP